MSISKAILNLAIITCLIALLGCPSEQEPPVENTSQPGTINRSEESPRADNLTTDKATSQETLQGRYTEINQNIQNLESKASEIPSESQEEFNQMMQSVQRQQAVVKERLDALGSSANEGWEQLKDSTEEALTELQNAYDKMAARFP
jgi:uncharacterized phage infection (PIP) family protein YhgE